MAQAAILFCLCVLRSFVTVAPVTVRTGHSTVHINDMSVFDHVMDKLHPAGPGMPAGPAAGPRAVPVALREQGPPGGRGGGVKELARRRFESRRAAFVFFVWAAARRRRRAVVVQPCRRRGIFSHGQLSCRAVLFLLLNFLQFEYIFSIFVRWSPSNASSAGLD